MQTTSIDGGELDAYNEDGVQLIERDEDGTAIMDRRKANIKKLVAILLMLNKL